MAIHRSFLTPYSILDPDYRWFPPMKPYANRAMKAPAPLVHKIRNEVRKWRESAYAGASATSRALLDWWFNTEHIMPQADAAWRSSNTTSLSGKPLKP